MENRHIFNELRLDKEIGDLIFGFFSSADLRKAALVSKEFFSLCSTRRNALINYSSTIKIYLDSNRGKIVAAYCRRDIDLKDRSVQAEAEKSYDTDNLDSVFKIIGVDRDELISNLNNLIGEKFKVTANLEQNGIFPEIYITSHQADENDFNFTRSSLELIQKLVGLGIEVVIAKDLKKTLGLQLNKPSRHLQV